MNLTPLKYFLFIENVTTVFRNYLCLKRRSRIIVLFWVIFDAFIISLTAAYNFAPEMKHRGQDRQTYFLMSTGFSIYLLITSLYYSKRFFRLLLNFDAFCKCFDDGVYNKKMLRAQKAFTCRAVFFCGVITVVLTSLRWPSRAGSLGWIAPIMSLFCNSVSDVRYMFQYFVIHCILFVVSEQMKVITRSVQSELSAIKGIRKDVEHTKNLPSVAVNHDKLNKWVRAYGNINDSSNLCNSMFSLQLTIMLLMVTVFYIILMYHIAVLTVGGIATFTALLPSLLSMAVFLTALLVISSAGQQIQNSYVELLQKLSELCVHLLENEEYYKLTKDLLRCVRTRPVRVHVLGTLDVNMSMLLSVVAFFTTYTVIVLQFNNVL